ncbi:MAG: Hydrogenase 3 maturation protease [Candidatus Aminicenantes bacterium ADurb.Bin147]|mgnify:FL=1|nr:MAG: Hydrogenase 3 maturation protease [Candidatus Aminicenantes bacterium ADurb.Bin147]
MNLCKPLDWKAAVTAAADSAGRVVVCGIGNDLRGDDAAGPLCLQRLRTALDGRSGGSAPVRRVLFIDGGETPENETGRMRNFHPDLVLLIDAARGGRAPGEIFIVDPESIADEEISTHRISLSLLVRYLKESVRARVLFLGIEPVSTSLHAQVSEPVRRAADELAAFLGQTL